METMLESLIRYFKTVGRRVVVTDSTVAGVQGRSVEPPTQDASTFPFLP
jgi:hypothetical protein